MSSNLKKHRQFTRIVFPNLTSTSMQNLQQVDSLLKDYYDAFRDKKNWVVFQDF